MSPGGINWLIRQFDRETVFKVYFPIVTASLATDPIFIAI